VAYLSVKNLAGQGVGTQFQRGNQCIWTCRDFPDAEKLFPDGAKTDSDLSLDMNNPSLPSLYWNHTEEDPIQSWKDYLKTWRNYIKLKELQLSQHIRMKATAPVSSVDMAAKLEEWFPAVQRNIELFTCLGMEGQRHFQTVEDADNYENWKHEDMITACTNLFGAVTNPVVAFVDLMRRDRRPDESVNSFLTDLRVIIKDTDFGEKENILLRNILVWKCGDETLQKELCSDPKINLEGVLTKMRAEEKCKQSQQQLAGNSHSLAASQFGRNKDSRRPQHKGCARSDVIQRHGEIRYRSQLQDRRDVDAKPESEVLRDSGFSEPVCFGADKVGNRRSGSDL